MNIPLMTSAELCATQSVDHPPEPAVAPSWEDLVAIEPRLGRLETLTIGLREDSAYAWGLIRMVICMLAGWEAQQFALRTATAYDVAYEHLLKCYEQ